MATKKRKRGWRPQEYTMQKMAKMSNQKIENEYIRLESLVNKRLSTFEKHGKETKNTRYIKRVLEAGNASTADMTKAVLDMRHFLQLRTNSFTAWQRSMRDSIQSFRLDYGIENLNMGNVDAFFDFIDWIRDFTNSYSNYDLYYSEITEAWNAAKGDPALVYDVFLELYTQRTG